MRSLIGVIHCECGNIMRVDEYEMMTVDMDENIAADDYSPSVIECPVCKHKYLVYVRLCVVDLDMNSNIGTIHNENVHNRITETLANIVINAR